MTVRGATETPRPPARVSIPAERARAGAGFERKREMARIVREHEHTFCRRCNYCQPCTENIPIQMILGLRSIVKRMGKDILLNEGRKSVLDAARNCSECGQCVERCPYELPIPRLIRENLAWADELLRTA